MFVRPSVCMLILFNCRTGLDHIWRGSSLRHSAILTLSKKFYWPRYKYHSFTTLALDDLIPASVFLFLNLPSLFVAHPQNASCTLASCCAPAFVQIFTYSYLSGLHTDLVLEKSNRTQLKIHFRMAKQNNPFFKNELCLFMANKNVLISNAGAQRPAQNCLQLLAGNPKCYKDANAGSFVNPFSMMNIQISWIGCGNPTLLVLCLHQILSTITFIISGTKVRFLTSFPFSSLY